jgi:hypothetical protein
MYAEVIIVVTEIIPNIRIVTLMDYLTDDDEHELRKINDGPLFWVWETGCVTMSILESLRRSELGSKVQG